MGEESRRGGLGQGESWVGKAGSWAAGAVAWVAEVKVTHAQTKGRGAEAKVTHARTKGTGAEAKVTHAKTKATHAEANVTPAQTKSTRAIAESTRAITIARFVYREMRNEARSTRPSGGRKIILTTRLRGTGGTTGHGDWSALASCLVA